MIEKTKIIAGTGVRLKNVGNRDVIVRFLSGPHDGLIKTLRPSDSVDIDKGVRYFCEYA